MLTIRRRLEDERGVSMVLFALLLVVLLGISGLVVDFGLVRANRQRNKSAADVAVTAGLQALNYNGVVAPFRGACAAIDYLRANHSELSTLTSSSGIWTNGSSATISSGDPCQAGPPASTAYTDYYNDPCVPGSSVRDSYAWFSATVGSVDVKVQAGYHETDFAGFSDEVGHDDYGDPYQDGCDNLAVIITEREQAGFGRVLGAGQMASTTRSVGRVDIGGDPTAAVGLLLLERHDCAAADVGGNTAQLEVKGTDDKPGMVHSDSAANGLDCGAKAALNGQYPTPGIVARQAPIGGAPGSVTSYALAGTAAQRDLAISHWDPDSGAPSPDVLAEGGTPGPGAQVGRRYVDAKYRTRIADLRGTATSYFSATSAPAGFTPTDCNPTAAVQALTTPVWVNCASFSNSATFQASTIIFTGNIALGGGTRSLLMPNAHEVYVKGLPDGTGLSVGNNKTITVNTGSAVPDRCDVGNPPAADVALSAWATLVIGSGSLSADQGELRLCRTMVFMMDGSLYAPGAAPASNTYKGSVQAGSGGVLRWTAPNTVLTTPTAAELTASPFEDLALWTESSGDVNASWQHSLGGGSDTKMKGVFFAPNANSFKLSGNSVLTITNSAQFIVRKLLAVGNSVMSIRADPASSVLVPTVSGFRLVR